MSAEVTHFDDGIEVFMSSGLGESKTSKIEQFQKCACTLLQVLMMVLPFLMIMVLPKLINTADPETQRVSFFLHELSGFVE